MIETPAPTTFPAAWHALDAAEALGRLQTSEGGLGDTEAARRLAEFGRNALAEPPRVSPLTLLAEQFKSLIIWILMAAAVVSGVLGEWPDTAAIAAIVVLNALIGFYQEYNAEQSIAALKRMTAPHARVTRDGRTRLVPAAELVPGDVVVLEAGDRVPADVRLLEASALRCVEASLTGESEPVDKQAAEAVAADAPLGDRATMAYMGTVVAAGSARAVVVATGMRTELGHIAGLIAEASTDDGTPLQQRLEALGKVLVWASLGIVALIFAVGLWRGMPATGLFLTSVSLAVAAVPEGLPAVVTIALAVGVQRMARRRALIRKLPAVETLGATSVIATDKTGTLTVGEMTARELVVANRVIQVSGEGYAPAGSLGEGGTPLDAARAEAARELAFVLVGCNNASLAQDAGRWVAVGDPTEAALLAAGAKAGVEAAELERGSPRLQELPFDSERKRMTVLRRLPSGEVRALVKGAPDMLLPRCTRWLGPEGIEPLTSAVRETWLSHNERMASRGLRVLGAAYRRVAEAAVGETDPETVEAGLVFVGLVGLQDPPRPEVRDAVARCRTAGIRVAMITGDHPRTALAIAREIGIAEPDGIALTGAELDALDDDALASRIERVSVFARVSANHKLRVVRAWRARGQVVAMTGDGVNDAPAIKGADVGVAMGVTGTEVTKEASDMVLADDNFASIVAAVEEGRGVYANIKKTLQYLLAGNTGELMFITACVLGGLPMPLAPIHLLWINLVTDGLPALALATDPLDADAMRQPPRPSTESLVSRSFVTTLLFTGALTAGVTMATYLYGLAHFGEAQAQTSAFAVLVYAELLRAFGARSETKTIFETNMLANGKLAAVVALAIAFQPWMHHHPLLEAVFQTTDMDWGYCLTLLAVGAVPLLVLEARKVLQRLRRRAP